MSKSSKNFVPSKETYTVTTTFDVSVPCVYYGLRNFQIKSLIKELIEYSLSCQRFTIKYIGDDTKPLFKRKLENIVTTVDISEDDMDYMI